MAWEPQAQQHLEAMQTKFGTFDDDVYYGGPIKEDLHASDTPRGYPDVYVNGEDVTVTIDPMKNAQWNLASHKEPRHSFTVHRGALKDHAGVMSTVELLNNCHQNPSCNGPPPVNFVPTTAMLDKSDKFTPRCSHNSSRGYAAHGALWGKLPAISQALYSNTLRDVPDWLVEMRVNYENTHGDRRRNFDCGGYRVGICR